MSVLASLGGVEPPAFRLGGGPSILLRYKDLSSKSTSKSKHKFPKRYIRISENLSV